jgi:hypothetical protein
LARQPEERVVIVAAHQTMMGPQGAPLPYDAEVEYLESTGTQYVDTGFVQDSATTRVKIRIYLAQSASTAEILFGSRSSANRNAYNCFYYPPGSGGNKKKFRYDFGDSATTSAVQNIISNIDPGWAQIETSWNEITITPDGGMPVTATAQLSSASNSYSVYLFAINTGGTATTTATPVRIASARISFGSTLVRDFQPVRVGTVGYLFDRVSGTLFGNAGTGAFTIGPDK